MLELSELQGGSVLPLVRSAEEQMRGDVSSLAAMITEQIHAACPDLPAGLHDGTYASTRSNIDAFFAAIRDGVDPASIPPPSEAQAYARALARSGLDLELLTRAYRHGEHSYSQMWKEQLRRSAENPESFAEAAMYVDQWLFSYISSVTRSLAIQHADEHERHSSPAAVQRLTEVRKILSGAQIDQTVSSQRLRYRLDGWHTSFVLWHAGGAPESDDSLEELGRLAATTGLALGATNTLALQLGDVFAGWANISASGPPTDVTYPEGLRAAFGLSHRGPEGFRRTHQEALKARQVSILAGIEGGPVSFADVALDALLTTDLAEANRFVVRELGELADRSGPRQRIVETLEAYLSAGSSMARVSRQLGVHENTVAYRIRRAEEILGRRIDEHQMELQAALRLARLLHPSG